MLGVDMWFAEGPWQSCSDDFSFEVVVTLDALSLPSRSLFNNGRWSIPFMFWRGALFEVVGHYR